MEFEEVNAIRRAMTRKGYVVHENANVPNIVGIRCAGPSNAFKDKLVVFWRNKDGFWESRSYRITTDPGLEYLRRPLSEIGTAILCEGQYLGAYKHGVHKKGGKERLQAAIYTSLIQFLPNEYKKNLAWMAKSHRALVQAAPVTVYRDNNKDDKPDKNKKTRETGFFAINIHRYHPFEAKEDVDAASAGCQVFYNPKDFDEFMGLLRGELRQDRYDYTLLIESDIKIQNRRVLQASR